MEFDLTTFLFETVNFLVLTFLLWRIVYRPLRASIRERRHAVEQDVERARSAREDAEERQRRWARREEELEALRQSVRREALDRAEQERVRLLERAREDAAAELARVRQLLDSERDAAERWVRRAVIERGTELAGRMLMALAPDAAQEALAEQLALALARDADALREEARGDRALEVEVTGARLPSPELVEGLRQKLRPLLGRAPRMSAREDPDLVGGVAVRIGDRLFDASVAGQLEALRELAGELERGDGSSGVGARAVEPGGAT